MLETHRTITLDSHRRQKGTHKILVMVAILVVMVLVVVVAVAVVVLVVVVLVKVVLVVARPSRGGTGGRRAPP